LENVHLACKECRSSPKLKGIIEVILVVGNYINGGSNRGEAFGFKLISLTKLADTKTTDNKSNLLNYIVGYLRQKKPELLDLTSDLRHVLAAAKVPFTQVVGDVNNLRKESKLVAEAVSSISGKDDPKNGPFAEKFGEFVKVVEVEMRKFDERVSTIQNQYDELCKLFAEDPKVTPPDEFFGLLTRFVGDLDASLKLFDFQEANKEKEIKQEEARKKRREQLANKKEGKKQDEKRSTYKDLLQDMQTGAAYKKNRKSIRDRGGGAGRDMIAAGLQEAKEKHQQKVLSQQLVQASKQ